MDAEPLVFSTGHLGLASFSLSLLALASLSISRFAPNAPGLHARIGQAEKTPGDIRRARLRVQLAPTLILGAAAIWIVAVGRHGHEDENWAYGMLLMLLWLLARVLTSVSCIVAPDPVIFTAVAC